MVEEVFGPDTDLDVGGTTEGGKEISPEDLVRVQENVRNAKEAAGKVAKSQKTNKQFALMLSFIFKYVEDEFLLSYVYELMTNFQISTIAIFGHFLPHIQNHLDITPYKPLYAEIWDEVESWEPTLSKIGSYYRDLYAHFPQLTAVPDSLYLNMVLKQLEVFGAIGELDQEGQASLRAGLKEEIFT